MIKRLFAVSLALAAAAALIIFGFGSVKEESASEPPAIGVGRITGSYLPFFEGYDGDRAVRTLTLLPLSEVLTDGTVSASKDGACAAEKIEAYFTTREKNKTAEFVDGGFTAVKYTLKDGVTFTNGTPMTTEDVLFSLYVLLDPLSGGERGGLTALSGYDEYYYGIEDVSEIIASAKEMIASGDAAIGEFLSSSGRVFASHIRDLVISRFCTDEMVSSHVLEGMSADEVRSNDALAYAYAVRMWNYGAFVYEYAEDPEGDYVGTVAEDGAITCRTTYAAAMEDDTYTAYVPSVDGDLVLDLYTGRYVAPAEGQTGVYKKVLSDKYARLRRSAIAGFRDSEGEVWSLKDGSYPDADRFFLLMKNAHTKDGVFDYEECERVESADVFSFSSDAAISYAKSLSAGGDVTSIFGAESDAQANTVTLYFEGSDVDAALRSTFYIVSKSACLDGYDVANDTISDAGAPKNSDSFRAHLASISSAPVSAGQYTVVSSDEGRVVLRANDSFEAVAGKRAGYERLTVLDITGKDSVTLLSDGAVFMSFTPVSASTITGLPEGVAAVMTPNNSYKYLMINPGVYKNADVRRAIASTVDPSVTVGAGRIALSRCVPAYHAYYAGDTESLFDPSGATASEYFAKANYTQNDDGVLIDPATREQAYFKFYLLPEEAGGDAETMTKCALDILKGLGAEGEIVYDSELKTSIYSEGYVPIYVLGWNVGQDLSMYERYALSSNSGAVRSVGFDLLSAIGVTEATGLITTGDGALTESETVAAIDELLSAAAKTCDAKKIKEATVKAELLISDLTFEIPLCEYAGAFLVKEGVIDPSSFPASHSAARDPLCDMYLLRPAAAEE